MPAVLSREPLELMCVFSDGSSRTFDKIEFAATNPALTADLLAGLSELIHPHGPVDKASTAYKYLLAAGVMIRWTTAAGFTAGAPELRRGLLAEFWMGCGEAAEAKTRRMLSALNEQTQCLRPDVAVLVAGRHFNTCSGRPSLAPYSETEWARLRETCQNQIDAGYAEHRQFRAAAVDGADPRLAGWNSTNVAWLLTQVGPSSSVDVGRLEGVTGNAILNRAKSFSGVSKALFPRSDMVIAYRLLFGIHTGIVPDGIAGLGLGDVEWAGDATVLLRYVKGRTARESLTLSRPAVRLLEQWLDHSALLRQFAPAEFRDKLWLRNSSSVMSLLGAACPTTYATFAWTRRANLLDDGGKQFRVHLHRIRTTFEAMRDRRAWFGSTRATIDPNHSPRVEGDLYLSVGTPAQQQAMDRIIVTAQQDLLRKATAPRVIDVQDAAAAAQALPLIAAELKLDAEAIAELVGGQRDVFVAACADPLSGLHGPSGKPCPARPWVCLLCPLAVFTSRHAANLLRLKGFFARQGQQMTTTHFAAVFGVYTTRIEEVLGCFEPTVLAAAQTSVTGDDAELPLRPEEISR